MRKTILTGLVMALALSLSTGAFADHKGKHGGVCPVLALKLAKDLKLSKKQVSDITKIKQNLMQVAEKASRDTQKALTPAQLKKYHEMADHICPMCGRCMKCEGKHKDQCPVKKKDKCCKHEEEAGKKKAY